MMAKYFGLRGEALNAALIWAVIMPGYILFGYNNAVGGGLLSLPSWIETFPRINTATTTGDTKTNNSRVQGTVIAMYTLGSFFGSLSCIWIGDKLGRKRTIMFGAFGNVIGGILQSTSFSLAQLIVGRFVSGIGFGAIAATAPNWQSECSKAHHRGSVVLLEGLFISFGLAIAAWVNFGMSHATGSVNWRFPLALSVLWSILVLISTPHMPESPRWLIKKGRIEEARQVLSALDDLPPTHASIEADIEEIQTSLRITGKGKFSDIFRNGDLRIFHRACLAASGQLFQQMSGINALAFYLTTIFQQDLGLSAEISGILGACLFTFQTLCSPIGVLTVDKLGRRKLMMFAAIGMGSCMAIAAGCASQPGNKAAVGVAAAAIFMFTFFFPIGFLGLTYLYAAEISPLSVRVPITSISTGTAWLFNFVVAEVTPVGFATIGFRYFIVYAVINFFLILPSVYFFFPETNGRNLEEVDAIFLESKSVFDSVRIAREIPKGTLARDLAAIQAARGEDLGKPEVEQVEKTITGSGESGEA